MTLRRIAAALVLPLVLAAALPAAGVVMVRPIGGKHGTAASPDSTAPHHGADAANSGTGAPGATRAKAGGGRVPHPALLHVAEPAADTLHSRAQDEANAAAREQTAQEQAIQSAPWDAAPHMRVRKTGDPVVDAAQLKRLNAELAMSIDPDRVRAGSLADDALADDALARQAPRRPDDAQQQLWRFLRDHPPHFDLYHLTQALRPLQGDTLLLMGHIDNTDGALVFKATNRRPLRLPLALFEQAAREAGVQLLFVGCKSARHSSAGFVDNLNSLDAAGAMARAMNARPSTLFDLYAALSGPQRVMQFDPANFFATRAVEITAGPDGAVLSTLHWSGPHMQAVSRAASAAGPTQPPQRAQADPPQPAGWANPVLKVLALGLLLSWLAGVAAMWLDGERGDGLAGLAIVDALAHLLLAPVLLTVFAEAVAGAGAHWWAWGGAVVLTLALVGVWAMAGDKPPDKAADQAAEDAPRPLRATLGLQALRLGLLAAPFIAVALLHTGWLVWPNPVMQGLLALYSLGRPLPGPWVLVIGGFTLYAIGGVVMAVAQGLKRWRDRHRARAGRAALWRDQLTADGITGAAAHAAVSARVAFEKHCVQPVVREARWDQVKSMTDGYAPDPWAGLPQHHWRLVAVPLLPRAARAEPEVAFGLIRVGSPFMHPLPLALLQRWRAQELRFDELPPLLAQVEPHLQWTDFAPQDAQPRLGAWIVCGALFVALIGGVAVSAEPGSDTRHVLAGAAAALLALLVFWPGSMWARRRWHARWLQRVRLRSQPAKEQQPAAAAG